jgi:D-xylose transport system substrate-binding protein
MLVLSLIIIASMLVACAPAATPAPAAEAPAAEAPAAEAPAAEAPAAEAPAAPAGKVKIGLSFSDYQTARWKIEADLMSKALEDLGYETMVTEANHDPKLQNDQIDNMVAQGAKGIIVVAEDADAAATSVNKAVDAGVKVISYDRLIHTTKVVYMTFDNTLVGVNEADGVVKALGLNDPNQTKWTKENPAKIFMMGGNPNDNNAHLVRDGQMSVVKQYFDSGIAKQVGDQWVENWDPAKALDIMANGLTANKNKIDAVIASNDGTAGGAIQALQAQKMTIPISGQDADADACNRIVKGTQTVTVFKDVRVLAAKAVEAMDALVSGKPVEGMKAMDYKALTAKDSPTGDIQVLFLDVVQVTKDNVYDVVVKSGFQKYDDVYRDIPEDQRPPKP